MKKLIFCMLIFVAGSAFGQFRGYPWGTQMTTVLKENPWLSKDDHLATGQDPKTLYIVCFSFLKNGGLAFGVQSPFFTDSLTANGWIEKYAEYQKILESKYGAPTSSQEDWHPASLKGLWDRETALTACILQLTTFWTSGDTAIQLQLKNNGSLTDENIGIFIIYKSLIFGETLENEEIEKKAEGL